ncbi:unnamed protein product [Musa acuminata subsp. malaccensis]|uniref:Transcription elongation factor 1 homolog n=1 Tax=Musa acuminata subsp. malaccensis TaxID=214687 RepID=A0A804IXR0_MUSAM|nr:unnamed protein product [Musa acuminata subsp. malaccensis]
MAKRRSRTSKLIKTKKVESKLEEAFTCPFCNHDKSVSCTLDTKLKIGEAQCWVCKESYATTIHHLTEPIDIYSEWVDECEKVDKSEELRDDDHRHSKKRRAILVEDYSIRSPTILGSGYKTKPAYAITNDNIDE